MILKPYTAALKNKIKCILKSPSDTEAEDILRLRRTTSGETDFMSRYPDEFVMPVSDVAKNIRETARDPKSVFIAAYIDGLPIGWASIAPVSPVERQRHRAGFGMSVLRDCWHIGVGSALLTASVDAARDMGYEQVELEVVAKNERARALYERAGFVTFGEHPAFMRYRDGSHDSAILMYLPL